VFALLREFTVFVQSMTKIDQISQRILRVLSRDGRISNLMLAEAVGL
jgi:DNA-binding Lrp family transcriptional regulator